MKTVADQTPADSASAQPAFLHKLADAKGCAERLAALPRPWVFTNGVFDVLHRGHVVYLAQARAAVWCWRSTPMRRRAAWAKARTGL